MKTSQVVLTSLSVLGVAGLGYAAYFDYRRRNDAAFRKSLIKDSKKTSKATKKEAAKKAKEEDAFIDELLKELKTPGLLPSDVEEREQYFLKFVSIGEQLFAMGADKHLEAAGAFFRALKVYPQPVELIMIYQKAVPKEVFDTIMRIVAKEVADGGEGEISGGNLDEVDDDGPSGFKVEESRKDEQAAPAAENSAQLQGTDSGTTSSQEWDTLSATSLTDTGVVVTPSNPATGDSARSTDASQSAADPPEAPVPSADASASSKAASTSDWSPAPVFGSPKKD